MTEKCALFLCASVHIIQLTVSAMRSLATPRYVTIFVAAIAITVHICRCDEARVVGFQSADNDTGILQEN